MILRWVISLLSTTVSILGIGGQPDEFWKVYEEPSLPNYADGNPLYYRDSIKFDAQKIPTHESDESSIFLMAQDVHEKSSELKLNFWDTFSETCLEDATCTEFLSIPPPPDFEMLIPPPPIPPFLKDLEELTKNDQQERDTDTFPKEERHSESFSCIICDWAEAGNQSMTYWSDKDGSPSSMTSGIIGGLSFVGCLSVIIGAIFIITIWRKKHKLNATGHSWFTFGQKRKNFSSTNRNETVRSSNCQNSHSTEINKPPCRTTRRNKYKNFLFPKFWQRRSSQTPLQQGFTSARSGNFFNEGNYLNDEEVYTELETTTRPTPESLLNVYSDVQEPTSSSDLNLCFRICGSERIYENSGYVLSESPSEPNECSLASSTPSSAYYSDVSYCEIQDSTRRKKKRRSGERVHPERLHPIPFSNCYSQCSTVKSLSNQIPLTSYSSNIHHLSSQCKPSLKYSSHDSFAACPSRTNPSFLSRTPECSSSNHGYLEYPIGMMNSAHLSITPNKFDQSVRNSNTIALHSYQSHSSSRDSGKQKKIVHPSMEITRRPLPPIPSVDIQNFSQLIDPACDQYTSSIPSEYI